MFGGVFGGGFGRKFSEGDELRMGVYKVCFEVAWKNESIIK